MAALVAGLVLVVQNPGTVLLMLIGVVVGIIFGAIPGLTATTAVALALPLTFGTTPENGMALLVGVYVGGVSGGLVAAALLGIPGTPASIATCFDAYPLTMKGQPTKALGTGIVASFIGNVGSVLILAQVAPLLADLTVKLGPWEYFSLIICALSLIVTLSREDMFRGLAAGFFGLALSTVGLSPIDGHPRLTFNSLNLAAGIDILAVVLGVFAIKQILKDFAEGKELPEVNLTISGFGITWKEFASNIWNIVRSFLIGLWLGFLPGMGSGIANIIAYAQAKSSSKHPEEFGKGCVDGIWATEVSNNAAVGGALIPALALGIPGDTVTAVLLGGLMIHGIQPGPLLLAKHPTVVSTIYGVMLLASICVLILQYGGMRWFPRILMIPRYYLHSILLVLSFIGAFASQNFFFNIWVMLVFAGISLLMDMFRMPYSPFILAFILGPLAEEHLRRGIMYANGSFLPFFTRPLSGFLLAVMAISLLWSFLKTLRMRQGVRARTAAS